MTPTPNTYDVIIIGAGSGGGFLAGEISPYCSVLILEAGPYVGGAVNFGVGSPQRRVFSTQINLGQYQPNNPFDTTGSTFFSYPMYMIQANQINASVQREPRLVGGGSAINVGAWVRPTLVDWAGFESETGVQGWTKPLFEPHFEKAEAILNVHRDTQDNWNKASVLYYGAAKAAGIPTFVTASNRKACIFCGHRLNAGMPCKYDSLMSTAITQIPKALSNGATLIDQATAQNIIVQNNRAVGVTYTRENQTYTVYANKLVVAASGAMGTPLLLRSSGLHLLNDNVGRYLRAHPGTPMDVLMPSGTAWNSDRGYQWNVSHYVMDAMNNPMDVLVHASASFPANTPWVAASVGFFGLAYKNLMRQFQQRAGAFLFELKPAIYGRVTGDVGAPIIEYPIVGLDGYLEPKTLADLTAAVLQVGKIYQSIGAIESFPPANLPPAILKQQLTLFVTTSGALHPQGTCRAGASAANSVVDTNCMFWGLDGLMISDASVIPNHISANPNATIMALSDRNANFVITQILGKSINPSFHVDPTTFRAHAEAHHHGEIHQEAGA
jgi:choline dehydrogenase-like flavoprotein